LDDEKCIFERSNAAATNYFKAHATGSELTQKILRKAASYKKVKVLKAPWLLPLGFF